MLFRIKVKPSVNFDTYEMTDRLGWLVASVVVPNYADVFGPHPGVIVSAFKELLRPSDEVEVSPEVEERCRAAG